MLSTLYRNNLIRHLVLILLILSEVSLAEKNDLNNVVKKMCLIGFNSEMNASEVIPPEGMGEFTCNCFVNKVSIGYSLELAREQCKIKATKKFDL